MISDSSMITQEMIEEEASLQKIAQKDENEIEEQGRKVIMCGFEVLYTFHFQNPCTCVT